MGQQCDVSLPQSMGEIVSPDINNQNERPKIPKKSPPPIPPSDEDQKNENDEDENDDKEKENVDQNENEIDEEMKQLGWDLANGGNLMNVMAPTDEEEYIK